MEMLPVGNVKLIILLTLYLSFIISSSFSFFLSYAFFIPPCTRLLLFFLLEENYSHLIGHLSSVQSIFDQLLFTGDGT